MVGFKERSPMKVQLAWGLVVAFACAGTSSHPQETGPLSPDASTAEATTDTASAVPWGPLSRGYKVMRGIVHLHSLYSHDGCYDGKDRPAEDSPYMLQCLAELRAAPCQSGVDFAFQTDHPANLRDHTFEEALHYSPSDGDELVKDEKGRVLANRVKCPEGSLVPHYLFFVGTEGKKQMPIGLSDPIAPEIFDTSYGDDTPLEKAQAAIAKVHEAGGFAFAAHTEETNISAERIVALPLDGMEIFNVHAMFIALLGDLFDFAATLDTFMAEGPLADLVLLPKLAPVAADVEKFDRVAPKVRIAIVAATDIHRNVELPLDPPPCKDGFEDGGMCENMHAAYPNFSKVLRDGGPFILNDGERLDSYRRSFRWFANYALVPAAGGAQAVREAVGKGRAFSAFDMFGVPQDFDFFAIADGKTVEMGEEVHGAKEITLYVRPPRPGRPPWWAGPEIDWSSAKVVTRVIHATEGGSMAVAESGGVESSLELSKVEPGAWRVEVSITPVHLKPALKGVEASADVERPYLYSNAIFVRP